MAILHVANTGSNTAPYETWAKAATTLSTAASAAAAGDTIYVSDSHTESGSGTAIAFTNGSAANQIKCLCGTPDAVSGITALATGASITSSSSTYQISGSAYIYGLTLTESYATSVTWSIGGSNGSVMTLDTCTLRLTGTGVSGRFSCGGTGGGDSTRTILRSCTFRTGAVGQGVQLASGSLELYGCAWEAGGSNPTGVFYLASLSRGGNLYVRGLDLSACSAGVNIIQSAGNGGVAVSLANVKLPASWSGGLSPTVPTAGNRYEAHNIDSGDTNYKLIINDHFGTLTEEATIVRTGGASDGTTTYSWEIVTTANAGYPSSVFRCPPILFWNETLSAQTATVEFVHDSATALKNNEIWIEVEYMGTSGYPLSLFTTTRAVPNSAAADTTDSSETWTTTGLTNPNTRKLVSSSFTPAEKGWISVTVCVAKASTTVYVDPKLTVA